MNDLSHQLQGPARKRNSGFLGGQGLPAKVLIADDLEIGQEIVTIMAQRLGVEVEKANNGHEAVQKVLSAQEDGQPFDLVLMDFLMPVVDGVEATQRIRKAGVAPHTLPIIALTATATTRELTQFRDAGGQAHILKPISLSDLEAVFEAWLDPSGIHESPVSSPQNIDLIQLYKERKTLTLATIDSVLEEQAIEPRSMANILDLLHKLAGTAGLFGEEAISRAARALEEALLREPNNSLDLLQAYRTTLDVED